MRGLGARCNEGAVQPSLTLIAETLATGVDAGGTIRSLSIRWRDRDKAQHLPCQMSNRASAVECKRHEPGFPRPLPGFPRARGRNDGWGNAASINSRSEP